MNTETVKGFADFLGPEARKREKIRKIIQEQFELYGFEPAETPIIEQEEFVRGENPNDEAVRDIFRLQDRGERKLALRYEFTFQLKRIAKNQKLPYKRYQIGYNFRDEPIRKGRTRQFIQCDADIIGSTVKDEAEILSLGKKVFEKLGMPVKIYVNNRKLINEILVAEKIEEKNRNSVIRELDKLDKLSKKEVADNLKEYGAEKLVKLFEQPEKEFEKYGFYKEIKELKKYCKLYGVDVEFRPFLARGLSYYNGTVFEIWSTELNASLSGGGSFLIDGAQSTGFALGLEPISLLTKIEGDNTQVQIISVGQDEETIRLAEKLREEKVSVIVLLDKNPGKAMEYANSKGIGKVIFVGKDEVESKKFKVKDMKTGKESVVSEAKLVGALI
jgi:histidyl-tRNA synthetase